MGIDRPDEDDAEVIPQDVPAAERKTPDAGRDPTFAGQAENADSDADRAAYNSDYRADVDAEYAWAEAVPRLQAAWEDHVKRFPRPERAEPTVHDDGSWSADGNLKLTPEQNSHVDRYCEVSAEIGKHVIAPVMRYIEAQDSSRHLEGFGNYLKGPDRLKEKVADELRPPSGLTITDALSAVPDAVRFTLCYTPSRYADGVRADVERLKAHGFELIKLKNTWSEDQYKGINTQWREQESGARFEVQFHTQVSFEAKELSHKAYERLRGFAAKDDEREELEAFQNAVCSKVTIPQGATGIDGYPRERHNG